ncbi:DnaJ domain protein [Natrialba magadii ATCC 43099]|uniref:DnaJ domain protein n=1 Tax=Natrialba magadii (strain ATCC 43099 / DSM 3394 / CCM 3739 / CIP 104546 / IAM 13178 / JCM 8861 / NBRC 102185 / NCIMB 2190 / MS3) TaxID=547559 RepID=D3SU29_NATMM|nr:DnaJ domain-containing protein [Natrialba magadii]ADD07118.1 DnaJ domain protein [Natrialba magadii ATCC 43099]ELY28740.1 heat shock protein DnaJ [Natrialba magadii ATCC 43099]
MGETYYDVLGVEPTATQDELESAYRERVLETHPDHNDAPNATEQFQRVSTAREVLTDEAERARYDRLGHEAYVQAENGGPTAQAGYSSTGATATTEKQTRRETNRGRRAGQRRTRDWSFEEIRQEAERERARSQSGSRSSSRSGSGSSSRSRTRSRSQTQRTKHTQRTRQTQQHAYTRTSTDTTNTESGSTASADQTDSTADNTTSDDFQYAVHDWNDEVELEWQGRALDHQTMVGLACIWLLYPVFIYASLTPVFPTSANAVVAVCTLGLVAYLLTLPRIAAGIFGSWSLLVPVGLLTIEAIPVSLLSIYGFLALAGVWVPFGYALAVWWVLRP